MLLQLAVENYKSINDKIVFSMLKTKDHLHNEYVKIVGDYQVLPNSLIIGTNGAGKSNLFKSVEYLQNILTKQVNILGKPHKFSDKEKPTKIDIQFLVEETRYAYGIDVLENKVMFEYLTIFEKEKEIIVYERIHNKIKGIHSIDEKLVYEHDVLLTYLYENKSNEHVKKAYEFLTEKMQVIVSDEDTILFTKAIERFNELEIQKIVNQLIGYMDIGVKRFYIKEKEIFLSYDNMDINLLEESAGTKKLFSILVILSDVLLRGKILFFDELEKNLHITLIKYINYLFNKPKSNPNNAQLIFSTHNTSLLNLSMFRRDQVWFMEKNFHTMTTEMYSLYNIIDVLENEDIEKGYIQGKYGATFKFSNDEVKLHGK